MPGLNQLADFVTQNIGTFVKGKWDYIGLAQLYPQLEVLGQLVPRKETASNLETTVVYQTETDSSGHGANPGDPVQPSSKKKAVRRKIKLVKWVDSIGWTLDMDTLQGKSDEHIVRQIQMDLVDFDLKWWQDLEHMMLQRPSSTIPQDNETMFGLPAYITSSASIATDEFQLYGGQNPYTDGRPGSLSVGVYPKYTNPVLKFTAVSDDSLFDGVQKFLLQRKLMGAVPNPRLLPDTPNDVWYVQLPLHNAITRYLQGSNDNVGMDAGRYRGNPMFKGIPISVWHALGHPDSPVRSTTCLSYLLDWNSFSYSVGEGYDRKIEGPKDIPLVPSAKYVTSEVWHQLRNDRPDRNLYITSDTPSLQP